MFIPYQRSATEHRAGHKAGQRGVWAGVGEGKTVVEAGREEERKRKETKRAREMCEREVVGVERQRRR